MPAWTISLNKPHVALLGRFVRWWLSYWVTCLVIGFWLRPGLDEVVYLLLLPVPLIAAYAVGCLGLAALRVWLLTARWSTAESPEWLPVIVTEERDV